MRLFLLLIIAIVFGAGIAIFVKDNSGFVILVLEQHTIEMRLWIAITLSLLAAICVFLFAWFLFATRRARHAISLWGNNRGAKRSRQQTNAGLIALTEGHWDKAEQLFNKGIQKSDSRLINYLLAARAAQEQKNYKQRDHYLQIAANQEPEASLAVGVTQAELQYESGQFEQALATLTQLKSKSPKHLYIVKLLAKCFYRLKDWGQLLELLPTLKKNHTFDTPRFEQYEQQSIEQLLVQNAERGAEQLQQFWQQLSNDYKKKQYVVICFSRLLIELGAKMEAESVIRNHLKKGFHPDLIYWYGHARHRDVLTQLNFAESFKVDANNNPNLLFTLGTLSYHAELWGKAKEYLSKSAELNGPFEAYKILALTQQKLHESADQLNQTMLKGIDAVSSEPSQQLLNKQKLLSLTNSQ